jgi:hypothetical protein
MSIINDRQNCANGNRNGAPSDATYRSASRDPLFQKLTRRTFLAAH